MVIKTKEELKIYFLQEKTLFIQNFGGKPVNTNCYTVINYRCIKIEEKLAIVKLKNIRPFYK